MVVIPNEFVEFRYKEGEIESLRSCDLIQFVLLNRVQRFVRLCTDIGSYKFSHLINYRFMCLFFDLKDKSKRTYVTRKHCVSSLKASSRSRWILSRFSISWSFCRNASLSLLISSVVCTSFSSTSLACFNCCYKQKRVYIKVCL